MNFKIYLGCLECHTDRCIKISAQLEHLKIIYFFDPCDLYMTFEVKLLITFVATHPLMLLTKFLQNPIKHVGGVAFSVKMTFLTPVTPT